MHNFRGNRPSSFRDIVVTPKKIENFVNQGVRLWILPYIYIIYMMDYFNPPTLFATLGSKYLGNTSDCVWVTWYMFICKFRLKKSHFSHFWKFSALTHPLTGPWHLGNASENTIIFFQPFYKYPKHAKIPKRIIYKKQKYPITTAYGFQ